MPFQKFIEEAGFISVSPLNEGASAYAFRAFDPILQRDVFIKYYDTFSGADERILSEPRKIASLFADVGNAAEHIVSLYSTREVDDGGNKYIEMVTEFCNGNSLYKKIREDCIYIIEALDFAKQAIDGLHVLHNKRFVHRDIKPSNLVLAGNKIKIIDLGAAAEITHGQNYLVSRSKHSIFYHPPESFDPTNHYGTFSDIYKIGLVLYELINGPINESPIHYLIPSVVQKEEKRLGKKYAEMLGADQSLIQDLSINILARKGTLLERGKKQRRLYSKELKRIVKGLTNPNPAVRVQSCSSARILLSSYTGPNWCEQQDGTILLKNHHGRDYIAEEKFDTKGKAIFHCKSSPTGENNYRRCGRIGNWQDFKAMLGSCE